MSPIFPMNTSLNGNDIRCSEVILLWGGVPWIDFMKSCEIGQKLNTINTLRNISMKERKFCCALTVMHWKVFAWNWQCQQSKTLPFKLLSQCNTQVFILISCAKNNTSSSTLQVSIFFFITLQRISVRFLLERKWKINYSFFTCDNGGIFSLKMIALYEAMKKM